MNRKSWTGSRRAVAESCRDFACILEISPQIPLAMPRSADDQRPLLRSSQAESPYGAVGRDTETSPSRARSPPIKTGEQGTQKKKFKEIWPLCIGLWTAVFCSALGATIVSNLQIEIGSYFRHGSLVSLSLSSTFSGVIELR